MSALEARQTRTHKTAAAAAVHSVFAATADPPAHWDASLGGSTTEFLIVQAQPHCK